MTVLDTESTTNNSPTHPSVPKTEPSIHPCPCDQFSTSTEVLSSLLLPPNTSSQRFETLVDWLRGFYTDRSVIGTEDEKKSGGVHTSSSGTVTRMVQYKCSKGGCTTCHCPNRVGAASCVLNAIRDGCRLSLETGSAIVSSSSSGVGVVGMGGGRLGTEGLNTGVGEGTATYDSAFPRLDGGSGSIGNHNNQTKNELVESAPSCAFVWGNQNGNHVVSGTTKGTTGCKGTTNTNTNTNNTTGPKLMVSPKRRRRRIRPVSVTNDGSGPIHSSPSPFQTAVVSNTTNNNKNNNNNTNRNSSTGTPSVAGPWSNNRNGSSVSSSSSSAHNPWGKAINLPGTTITTTTTTINNNNNEPRNGTDIMDRVMGPPPSKNAISTNTHVWGGRGREGGGRGKGKGEGGNGANQGGGSGSGAARMNTPTGSMVVRSKKRLGTTTTTMTTTTKNRTVTPDKSTSNDDSGDGCVTVKPSGVAFECLSKNTIAATTTTISTATVTPPPPKITTPTPTPTTTTTLTLTPPPPKTTTTPTPGTRSTILTTREGKSKHQSSSSTIDTKGHLLSETTKKVIKHPTNATEQTEFSNPNNPSSDQQQHTGRSIVKNNKERNDAETITVVASFSGTETTTKDNLKSNSSNHDEDGSNESQLTFILDRLSVVYSTLILHSLLVPSVALELQLLLRLLSLTTNNNTNTDTETATAQPSSPINPTKSTTTTTNPQNQISLALSKPSSCRYFAVSVLTKIRPLLLRLGRHVLTPLVRLLRSVSAAAAVDLFPDLVTELEMRCGTGGNGGGAGGRSRNISSSSEKRRNGMVSNGRNGNGVGDGVLLPLEEAAAAGGGIGGKSNAALLTVPFEEKRDSRHYYRSRNLTDVFNNREECRDTFLFQLRAFQEMRGGKTSFNPSQIEQTLRDIRFESRKMMQNLLSGNVPWFVEYFCDLLLQIGTVPMQETDRDIMKHVGDKDKLQKLHSRFTSKATQKNKSSQRLDETKTVGSSPEQYFTGHQEFFFHFIQSVDSYCFGIHLRRRLVELASSFLPSDDNGYRIKGLEQRLSMLQLVVKFIGMLAFSPHWNDTSPSSTPSRDRLRPVCKNVIDDSLHTILPVKRYVEDSWRNQTLVVTIPWVLQFLRMAKWDTESLQSSPYCWETASLLRSIQKEIAGGGVLSYYQTTTIRQSHGNSADYGDNLLLVTLQLESFFADVVGLGATERLYAVRLPAPRIEDDEDDPCQEEVKDTLPVGFSRSYVLSSSSHLDELQKLIDDLNLNDGKLTGGNNGALKKLKPYVLTGYPTNSLSTNGTSSDHFFASLDPMGESKLEILSRDTGTKMNHDETFIQEKLVDAFFHQHKDLKIICEFIVDVSVKNAFMTISQDCISPLLEESLENYCADNVCVFPVDLDWYLSALLSVEQKTVRAAIMIVQRKVERQITYGIKALAPPVLIPQTVAMATSLSIKYAHQKCESLVLSSVKVEAKRKLDERLQLIERVNNGGSTKQIKKKACELAAKKKNNAGKLKTLQPEVLEQMPVLTKVIEEYLFSSSEICQSESDLPIDTKHGIVKLTYFLKADNTLSSAKMDRSFDFLSLATAQRFATAAYLLITHWFTVSEKEQTCPSLFVVIIKAVAALGDTQILCGETTGIGTVLCNTTNLKKMISWDTYDNRTKDDSERIDIAECLALLVRGNIITKVVLERALLKVLESFKLSHAIIRRCLYLLRCIREDTKVGTEWTPANKFVMPLLTLRLSQLDS